MTTTNPGQPLQQLSSDVRDFWVQSSEIRRIKAPIDPLRFYKDFVSRNEPAIICGAIDHWPALKRWKDDSYLISKTGNPIVSVNVTPNGLADCVIPVGSRELFVKPEERKMSLQDFFAILNNHDYHGVPYLSHQNDSLRIEFQGLMDDDIEPSLGFASDIFDNEPDAVNLWIGDERSVSSLHKDHYENLYAVITGEKRFTLYPPADLPFLYEREYAGATYWYNGEQTAAGNMETARTLPLANGEWSVVLDKNSAPVRWIAITPYDHQRPNTERDAQYPLHQLASPLHVVVRPGEVLYLPSLWYHQVAQKGRTIAVNYWHDMQFDCKWVYYNLLRNVIRGPTPLLYHAEDQAAEESQTLQQGSV